MEHRQLQPVPTFFFAFFFRWRVRLPKLVPYTSRHSTATLLPELGVPEKVRMAIMGQSSAAAHRNYIHVSQDQSRLALGKLETMLALD